MTWPIQLTKSEILEIMVAIESHLHTLQLAQKQLPSNQTEMSTILAQRIEKYTIALETWQMRYKVLLSNEESLQAPALTSARKPASVAKRA